MASSPFGIAASIFLLILCLLLSISSKSEAQVGQNKLANACYVPSNDSLVFRKNLNILLSHLNSTDASSYVMGFYQSVAGNVSDGEERLYGLFLCRADLNSAMCQACVANASQEILQACPGYKDSTIWYDMCMLTYSYQPIYRSTRITTYAYWYEYNMPEPTSGFNRFLGETLDVLIKKAANAQLAGKKFAANKTSFTESQPLYTLAQCTPDLMAADCNKCLQAAVEKLPRGKGGAMSLLQSCNIRYGDYSFYNETAITLLLSTAAAPARAPGTAEAVAPPSSLAPQGKGKISSSIIVAIFAVISVTVA